MSRRCRLCPLGGSCPSDPRPAAPPRSCRSQGGSLCPCIESSCKGRTRAGRWCSSTSAALHLGRPPRCNLQMKAGSEPQARQGAMRPGVARDCTERQKISRQGVRHALRSPLPHLEWVLGAGRGWGGESRQRHSFPLFAFLLVQMAV